MNLVEGKIMKRIAVASIASIFSLCFGLSGVAAASPSAETANGMATAALAGNDLYGRVVSVHLSANECETAKFRYWLVTDAFGSVTCIPDPNNDGDWLLITT